MRELPRWAKAHGAKAVATLASVAAVSACGPSANPPRPVAGGAPGSHATTPPGSSNPVPPTTSTVPTPAPPTSSAAPTAPACSNASVIAGWPAARRAAELVVVPSFDFDLSPLAGLVGGGIGGVLFLGDAPAPADLGAQITAFDAGAPAGGAPLFMADEEGGGVERLDGVVSSFPWPRDIAATMTPDQAEALAASVGAQMRQAGVTVDLAPVLDVDGGEGPSSTDPDGSRSFSADPATASRYGVAFLQGLAQAGVLPVVKHFPGLGGASGNTDDAPATTQPLSALRTGGLVPFQAAIGAHAPAVMIANASVPGLTTLPASLSPAVIGGLLRGQLGFTGLVMTDSLSAGAISGAGYSIPQAAVAALEAGADQIMFGSTPAGQTTAQVAGEVVDAIVAANASGALPTAELDQAVGQVIRAKGVDLCEGAASR